MLLYSTAPSWDCVPAPHLLLGKSTPAQRTRTGKKNSIVTLRWKASSNRAQTEYVVGVWSSISMFVYSIPELLLSPNIIWAPARTKNWSGKNPAMPSHVLSQKFDLLQWTNEGFKGTERNITTNIAAAPTAAVQGQATMDCFKRQWSSHRKAAT